MASSPRARPRRRVSEQSGKWVLASMLAERVARFCVERRAATLAEVQAAAWAFENRADELAALTTLQRLCSR